MAEHTLCWDCARAADCTCSWSSELKPVEGWTAKPDYVEVGTGKFTRRERSYVVQQCPLFKRDSYDAGQRRMK